MLRVRRGAAGRPSSPTPLARVAAAAASPGFLPAAVAHAAFFLSGIALVTFNKWMYATHRFKFPVTLICFTSLVSFFVSAAVAWAARRGEVRALLRRDRADLARRVLPIGLLFAVDVAMTNEAFTTLSVPLTEVVKAFLPAILIAARVLRGAERLTPFKAAVVAALCGGVALTSAGDGTFAAAGFAEAAVATVSAALKLLALEAMLSGPRRLTPLQGLLCFLPVVVVSLALPWWWFERARLLASPFMATREAAAGTARLLCVAAALATVLNAASLVAISLTSAFTLVVTGVCRLVFIIVFTAFFFSDFHVTPLNQAGILLSLAGIVAYQFERARALAADAGGDGDDASGDDEDGDDEDEDEDDEVDTRPLVQRV